MSTLNEEILRLEQAKAKIDEILIARGVSIPTGATLDTYHNLINSIQGGTSSSEVTATKANVLAGTTTITADSNDAIVEGTMVNHGAVSQSLNCGGSYTIPAGYHNGSGKITANSLASQTDGTATAAQILKDQTAYVDGVKVTGTMANNGAVAPSALGAGGSYTIPAGYHNGSGKVTVQSLATMTASGDATAAHILSGKKAYVDGNLITGNMTDRGAQTPSALNCGGSYTIPAGYHNGSGKVTANSLANQTKVDSGKTAVAAAQMLSGYQGWVNGSKISGSMANQGAQNKTITPSASAQSYTIPAGYHNGSGKISVPAVSNLSAANIKKGVVVGGVTGTWSGYVATATDLYIRGNNAYNLTKRSSDRKSTFESGAIYVKSAGSTDFIFRNDPESGSTISINLSPYTKINVEFYCTAKDKTYVNARFAYLLNSDSFSIINVSCSTRKAVINQSINTTQILSADISDINATIKGLGLRMYSSNDTSDNSLGGVTGQIYRIWLS